jgi:hypothetical protein
MTVLDGAVLGKAHYATRAALEEVLRVEGLDFPSWITLSAIVGAGGRWELAALRDRITETRPFDLETLDGSLSGLRERGLLTGQEVLEASGVAREMAARVQGELGDLTRELYGDLDPAELQTAGRVLELVTRRARDRLG